ncbi:peptidoglycan DD-metalloendopeptidase family protein [Flavobacterium franklandianum]|uniref:Peptidoglycan DD-metalloendopeptidase family protein n=1 Tax=Flavobacterium franklandianum TaxID=2594430 RepID=A0A553C716_9FLAO|nr:peptidoglycan DD-metalloendopeptidase family protein [Flavobacterium franklandianum]TRX16309.1 peptidoglycan DD-metalloendopeptidase family protein [Flavobacterium franklandianum]
MPTIETLFSKLDNSKVIDDSIPYSQYTPIDLSVSNSELSEVDLRNPNAFETFIEDHLRKNKAKVAFGGYNEVRNLYKQKALFNDEQASERNIHIGIDLWIKAGTAVLAALDGTVYGFDYNTGAGNYGPTIILKHSLENQTFYTLYGHLSAESIEDIEINTFFKKKQQLATLGDSSVNGGYAPHLHFQIIKNIGKNFSDYPGVCSKNDLEYYLENCPNPNLLLKIQ